MTPDLFTLIPASERASTNASVPIIASLPHSGLQVPKSIAEQFTEQHMRTLPNSDWHLQPLYSFLPELGVTMLQANYSRYVVDLNRALKPPFLGSFWSAVVPAQTAFTQPIYKEECLPSKAQVLERIETYYTPYHQKLTALLNEAIAQHGKVYLLDLHSFMGLISDDVCLGNAKGTTCSAQTIESVADSFSHYGYGVVKNKVFAGGYITRHYGHWPNVEALQIELRYPTYLSSEHLPPDQTAAQIPKPAPIPSYQSPFFTAARLKLKSVISAFINKL